MGKAIVIALVNIVTMVTMVAMVIRSIKDTSFLELLGSLILVLSSVRC